MESKLPTATVYLTVLWLVYFGQLSLCAAPQSVPTTKPAVSSFSSPKLLDSINKQFDRSALWEGEEMFSSNRLTIIGEQTPKSVQARELRMSRLNAWLKTPGRQAQVRVVVVDRLFWYNDMPNKKGDYSQYLAIAGVTPRDMGELKRLEVPAARISDQVWSFLSDDLDTIFKTDNKTDVGWHNHAGPDYTLLSYYDGERWRTHLWRGLQNMVADFEQGREYYQKTEPSVEAVFNMVALLTTFVTNDLPPEYAHLDGALVVKEEVSHRASKAGLKPLKADRAVKKD